jgi:uncharacterized repeat protein (TIGR01451 family)
MNPHALTRSIAAVFILAATPLLAQDSAETLREQAMAQQNLPAALPAGIVSPEGGAGGPLFVGVDDTAIGAFRIDVGANSSVQAFTGAQLWGSAYDEANDRVLFNAGSQLFEWPVGGAPNLLGTITDAGMTALNMTGLAFGNGTLYACRNIANEAIYAVDLNTLVATVFIDYDDASFDCGGLAFNPADGMLYMTNDDTTPLGNGLFRMNMDGSGTLITPYPAGQTDIDGLAIGDGRAYFVIDEPGDIHVWDFGLAAFQTPLTSPFTTSETFSAGTWITPPVDLYLNEVVHNTPGADAPNEYLEFRGTPGATIPAGTYLVEIEGDGTGAGAVDRVFDLGGRTLGANGYLVFLQQNNTYVVDPQATVATATGAGWTGLGGANDIENGTVSLLLITAAAAPTIGTDVDADNNGVLDGVGATWTILDSVGGTDGTAGDIVYGAQPCGPTGFTPGSFHRIGESTGSGNADWVCSVPFGTAPNFTLSTTNTLPASFAGRALDHIGSFNFPALDADLVTTLTDTPDPVLASGQITYVATVTNNGPADAADVALSLPMAAGTTFVSATPSAGGLCTAPAVGANGTIDCTWAGATVVAAARDVTVVVGVPASTLAGTVLSVTATATTTTNDPDPANNAATTTTTVNAEADLSMTLSDTPDPVVAGTQLTYTATVTNGGPSDAQNVQFALPLPAGTSYVSATPSAGGTCTNVSPVTCTWAGATAPMADRSATIVVLVAANVANGSNLSATATASSATTDPNAANDTATTMTAVQTQADIAMTAFTDSPDPVVAGTNLTYQVAMVNNGPSDAQNARFSLPLPTGTSFVSAAPSAGGSCTNTSPVTCTWAGATAPTTSRSATIVVLVAPSVLQGTTLNAVVTGTSDSTDPVAGNNSLATSTLVNAVADLQIGLTASAAQSELGQTVTFTATSTNGGPSDAQNVVLSITLSPDFRYGSHTASAGAVCTTPQIGNSGVISCTWAGPTIPGAVRTLAVNAASFVAGTSSIQAATSSDTTDPVPTSNNVASTSVLVGNPVEAIPTLSQWGLVLLSLLVGLIGVALVRRD